MIEQTKEPDPISPKHFKTVSQTPKKKEVGDLKRELSFESCCLASKTVFSHFELLVTTQGQK